MINTLFNLFKRNNRTLPVDLSSLASEMETICSHFITASRNDLSWKWDDRFNMVLSEFSTSKKDLIHSHLQRFSETTWDNHSIRKAPKSIIRISRQLGGINENQLLYVSSSTQEAFVICAWWPWGNGEKISIRLSPSSARLSPAENTFLSNHFKKLFGV